MSTTQTLPSGNGTATQVPGPRPPRLGRTSRRPRIWWLLLIALAIVACGAAAFFLLRARLSSAPVYQTQAVTRGTLVQTVTSSGTVNPQNTINVGTQVSGTISELDVDFNSRVHVGEVLAKLDPTSFNATVAQATAQLAQTEAQAQAAGATVTAAQATYQSNADQVAKAQAALTLANETVTRDKELVGHGYIAQSQVDTDASAAVAAQSALDAAHETTASSYAQYQNSIAAQAASNAAAQASTAQLTTAQYNLAHTIITSPVDGVVIARDVSIGQTVAASLQTPTLFAIAQDLSKMEVDLAVGEPDIGNVKTGEAMTFSVLAYPNRTYRASVSQVRKNPTTVNNVVTYDVVSLVSNQDQSLLPGMTASATLNVAKVQNDLIVPVQALQYRPQNFQPGSGHHHRGASGSSPAAGAPATGAAGGARGASPWGSTLGGSSGSLAAGQNGLLFVDRGGKPVPAFVQINLVQGTQAAVTPRKPGALTENDQVILSDAARGSSTHTQSTGPAAGGPGGIGRVLGR
jgi:HlyD family secretion protein